MSKKALELKPCPLCGGKAEVWRAHPENPKLPAWVACMDRCLVLVTREFDSTEEAVAVWNSRAGSDAAPDLLEALKDIRDCVLEGRSGFEVDIDKALKKADAALSKATGGE